MAGVLAAWLLDGTHETVLFESRGELGGNARSRGMVLRGQHHWFDLGTQEVSDEEYPLHARLLRVLGFGAEDLVAVPGSRTILRNDPSEPLLVGPHAPDTGWSRSPVLGGYWDCLSRFLRVAMEWEERDRDWRTPLAELLEESGIADEGTRDVLRCLPSSLFGCSLAEADELSARAATAFFLGGDSSEAAPSTENLRGGLESVVWSMAADLCSAEIRTGVTVENVLRDGQRYELVDSVAGRSTVDAVVFAAPPPVSECVLSSLAGAESLRGILGSFPYRRVEYGLHRDPVYMPARTEHWSTNNVSIHDGWGETSTWYGPINGADVFKSQLTHRPSKPRVLLGREEFDQLLPVSEVFTAQRRLAERQGEGSLYFAGHYTAGLDSQETTVRSAVDVARSLAPRSPRLGRLLDEKR
ncbi:hypothetical protein CDG81_11980 [Actinopolyspora erythraea]|uniref:Amine oxidase domain-containing protein n=2 Tax=Actinopolyspora erythraea TaxID=414996 RepID=A0A099D5L4_9ACTN|nr:hypothetical protein CDG81_11980 [Actinopolyspora erythraea]KGI81231.1 hypothetical protein IL38_12065 [Actinopolyspora erythraea]